MKKLPGFLTAIAICVVACIAFSVSGVCVMFAEKRSFPPAGVYFADHEHSLSFSEKAYNPYFTLQVYEVKGGLSFLASKEMYLRDQDGKPYSLKDMSLQVIFSDFYFASYRIVCVLDRNDFTEYTATLTQAVLVLSDGTEKSFPIGRVYLNLTVGDDDDVLSYSGYTQNASELNSYNVKIINNGETDVFITGLSVQLQGMEQSTGYYDADYVYGEWNDEVILRAGEEITLNCTFTGREAFRAEPFCELKPTVYYRIGRKEKRSTVNGKSTYFALLDREEIKSYLWGIYEKYSV